MDIRHETQWVQLVDLVYNHFSNVSLKNTLYRVNMEPGLNGKTLYSVFLKFLDKCDTPNYYKCKQCENFINTYGNLVYFNENKEIKSALFPDIEMIPSVYQLSVYRMKKIIETSSIVDIYKTHIRHMGEEESGGFKHLHVKLSKKSISYIPKEEDVSVIMSAQDDIFSSLKNAIISYDIDVIETAIKILHTNSIPSSDTKVLELLTMDLNWFKEVYSDYRRRKDDAILWNAVGLYGFRAYINHSLLGSFLEYAKVFLEKGIL